MATRGSDTLDTLGRMTDASRARAATSATSSGCGAPSVRRRRRGSSTGSAPTSGCAARRCDRHVLIERRTLERRLVGFVTARRSGPERRRQRRPRRHGPVTDAPATTASTTTPAPGAPPPAARWPSSRTALPAPLACPGGTQIGGNMVIFGLTIIIAGVDGLDGRGQRADPDVPRSRRSCSRRSPACSSTASTGGSS